MKKLAAFILALLILTGCSAKTKETATEPPAESANVIYPDQIMDGEYYIEVSSSSSMFRIIDARLTVANGAASCVITLSGDGYSKLYMGTGEEALSDSDDKCVYFEENAEGKYTYKVPVTALDAEINCAAWSIRKEQWYDRVLIFKSASIPKEKFLSAPKAFPPDDGQYTAEAVLTGGSGKAKIQSPLNLSVSGGKATALVVWSSSNYEYMTIDGKKYYPVDSDGNSAFEIPFAREEINFSALTTAMSQPHEIEYTLRLDSIKKVFENSSFSDWKIIKTITPQYAKNFSIDYYAEDFALIKISDGSKFLLVPPDAEAPGGLGDIKVLRRPVGNVYLAATSVMTLFDALDSLDAIALSGSRAESWFIENAKTAMEKGEILYAGKYSAPDYELITSANCDLAIESTMINNVPEVAGKLEEIGVPVLIDQSSYETHPLGRTEWIKLYAAIVGKEDLAREIFKRQTDYLDSVASAEPTGKTAAFFYINSSGSAVARKSGDYVAKMIELAGGAYIFENLGDSETATGTVILEMENFYADAKDADFIIYNTAVDDEIYDLAELLAKNPLLADFKAVKTGGVWCVNKNLYQETTQFGLMISDFRRIFTESGLEKLNFMYKLK